MARYIRHIQGYNQPISKRWRVKASTTINEGDLVALDATTRYLIPAVAASTTVVGIAQQSIVTGATVTIDDAIEVLPVTDCVIRVAYTGTTKTTLADTDLVSTLFDLSNATTINLDDTTGGMCSVMDYDNTHKWADVIIASANIAKIG
ncbi:hypothetical protein H7B90_23585 [Cohnella xylanilytica]|uniref:Uncharacterized protein n=1 Tax=Cohnella xylanilytica TaxID=557555 RepID=A0A841U7Z4_9BACL|nr:hypothetical protein [Cohnella xylanilytica]MBB6694383.1 hypothetical protein [Cohnella xylanilytica]